MVKEIHLNGLSFITAVLAFIALAAFLPVTLFTEREIPQVREITAKEAMRLSALSPAMIVETESELYEGLLESAVWPILHGAEIEGDEINVILDGDGWKSLSLGEKSIALLEVAAVTSSTIEKHFEATKGLKIAKPNIRIYDIASTKELAFWSEEGGIILK